MEFHVPHKGDYNDEELYQDIIYYLEEELDNPPNTDKRYEYLRWKDDQSNIYEAEVGEVCEPLDETVIAIFEGGFMFYICTPRQGVPGAGKLPHIVQKGGKVLYTRKFDDF